MTDSTPNEELRELIDGWQEALVWAKKHDDICSNEAINVARVHINELEELIGDE